VLILVTGGSRSGKSRFAQQIAEQQPGPHAYVATAQALDEEMRQRIEAHRRSRPPGWTLIEEPIDVPGALRRAARAGATVILDCVTLWMSNLLLADGRFGEGQAETAAQRLLAAAREGPAGTVIVVTNEVGSGVVPDAPLGRRFRDCAGRANEVIARGADEVYLLVSGIPVRVKPAPGAGLAPGRRETDRG
jgi:adenosylcobinamide kinase/adenosylcobinamide-phosphate guanylyltransferase